MFDLSPYWRLFFFQPLAALIVIAAGLTIFVTNPLGEGILYFDQLQIPIHLFGWGLLTLPADLILAVGIIWMMTAPCLNGGIGYSRPLGLSMMPVAIWQKGQATRKQTFWFAATMVTAESRDTYMSIGG